MMLPSIFGGSLFDDFMDSHWDKDFFGGKSHLMGAYEKNMENGYLTINASKNEEREEKNESGVYIRRERYTGQCARSFYVGEMVQQQEIKAKFENGILHLVIPKKQETKVEQKKYIAIEG